MLNFVKIWEPGLGRPEGNWSGCPLSPKPQCILRKIQGDEYLTANCCTATLPRLLSANECEFQASVTVTIERRVGFASSICSIASNYDELNSGISQVMSVKYLFS